MDLEKFEKEATECTVKIAELQKKMFDMLRECWPFVEKYESLYGDIRAFAENLPKEEANKLSAPMKELADRLSKVGNNIISEEEYEELNDKVNHLFYT